MNRALQHWFKMNNLKHLKTKVSMFIFKRSRENIFGLVISLENSNTKYYKFPFILFLIGEKTSQKVCISEYKTI